jgi:hypothetical protein
VAELYCTVCQLVNDGPEPVVDISAVFLVPKLRVARGDDVCRELSVHAVLPLALHAIGEHPLNLPSETVVPEAGFQSHIALVCACIPVKKILDLGITISDLQQNNVDPLSLFENSIFVGTLEKSGYTSAALTTAGFGRCKWKHLQMG